MSRYVKGQWNAICDSCGFQFKSGELRERWDGFMVCENDWEPRHPMDFFRAPERVEKAPEWTRPKTPDANEASSAPTYITIPPAGQMGKPRR